MSGTSLDGVDAVLVRFSPHFELIGALAMDMPPALRSELLSLCQPGDNEIDRCGAAGIQLGALYAQSVQQLLATTGVDAADVAAIGCHGQTIRHRPGPQGFSVQIGSADTVASSTGITTVTDFRNKDMVLGGQGAPLVPAFHGWLFGEPGIRQAVVNIGGMANITLLEGKAVLGGYDTGPGNVLMDLWAGQQLGKHFDEDGNFAASGHINLPLLDALLEDPYILASPPKSTGRERFNAAWLTQHIPAGMQPADVQATLLEFTAKSITDAVAGHGAQRLVVCGGGARNAHLMARIRALFGGHCSTSDGHGLHPDWVEAAAFAWLARARLHKEPGNAPSVTGAQRHAILGAVYLP